MTATSLDIYWRELKTAYIVHRFQLLNIICIYGNAFYGLTRMFISKI